MDQEQLNKLRLAAGLAPKYDRAERKHLEEKATKKATEQSNLTEAANNRAPANVLAEIARRHLNIRTLATQNSDSLDFHDVSVWGVNAALKAAYKAGQASVKAQRTVKEGDESKSQIKKTGVEYDPKGGERYPVANKNDSDTTKGGEGVKKGSSSENYKSPKNKSAKQMTEAKKAKKDYDGDGKIESEEDEHRGVVDKAIKKSKKRVMKEMDLEMDLGDTADAEDMKARRMELIRKAAEKVRGGKVVDVGDEMDYEPAHVTTNEPTDDDHYDDEMSDYDDEMSGEMDFGGDDFEWGEEDCEMATQAFQPEDEEAYAAGFDAFRRGEPQDANTMNDDYKNGYETARFTRMSAVAESSSEGYQNPKGTKLKADPKSGAGVKKGKAYSDKPHTCDSMNAKSENKGTKGLKKVKESAQDATVFDKDYHHPAGANNIHDMAQHSDKPHVQDGGQFEKVNVPTEVKKSLKEEIKALREDAGKVRYRDEYRADFYENTAQVFEMLLHHLEEGTKHSLLLAQIDMNRVMSPMTHRIPRNTYMYIVRGGKPASLNELFYEVKVKADKGVDPSKEKYTK